MSTTHQQFASIADAGARLFTHSHLAHSHQHITHQVRRQRVARASATTVASIGLVGAGALGLVSLSQPSTTVVGPAASGSADPDAFPSGVPTAETSTSAEAAASTLEVQVRDTVSDVAEGLAESLGVSVDEANDALIAALPSQAEGDAEGWIAVGSYPIAAGSALADVAAALTNSSVGLLEDAGVPEDQWRDTVIKASIVQAEVPDNPNAGAHQMVADVIANRLELGIPLAVDTPLIYALDHDSRYLTEEQMYTESPYNTMLNDGLPPTAISVISAESIQSVTQAPQTKAQFYYYTGPNTVEAAETYEEAQELLERLYVPESN